MRGWDLNHGELICEYMSEDDLWSIFNFVFSENSKKRNTYKFGLVKSILDNLFNAKLYKDSMYFVSYEDLFGKFARNYWKLVAKYELKQMRSDGRSEYSKVETLIQNQIRNNDVLVQVDFESIESGQQRKLIQDSLLWV